MARKQEYGNESITSLKGADRVRKRPAVIFGSDGVEGCAHSIFEIVSNSIDEARDGHGDTINVTRCKDGSVISINDKLDNIEKQLDDRRFLRCHKSYLVSMNYINKLENRHFTLISNITIPIPKESLNSIKKQYADYIEN